MRPKIVEIIELLRKVRTSDPHISLKEIDTFMASHPEMESLEEEKKLLYNEKAFMYQLLGQPDKSLAIHQKHYEKAKASFHRKENDLVGMDALTFIENLAQNGQMHKAINIAHEALSAYVTDWNSVLPILSFLAANDPNFDPADFSDQVEEIKKHLNLSLSAHLTEKERILLMNQETRRASRKLTELQATMPDRITDEYLHQVKDFIQNEPVGYFRVIAADYLQSLEEK